MSEGRFLADINHLLLLNKHTYERILMFSFTKKEKLPEKQSMALDLSKEELAQITGGSNNWGWYHHHHHYHHYEYGHWKWEKVWKPVWEHVWEPGCY
jgi:bacteriocin-like protein